VTNNNDNYGSDSKSFDYDFLVEESLKNVVKKVLKITSETGLIGNSHFFITFNGNHPSVTVPPELKNNDNSEIKIIIQHQFWDLKTSDDHFEVTLSFNGEKKNISVALHYRNAPGIEKKATSVINRIISGSDLKLLKGNKVLELVPKNSNKGKAINFFMNKQPFLNKIPVFIGDDVTDEYGFKSVNNLGGYSIKVGYQSNTLANFFIKDTTSVLKFLNFVSFCSKKIRCQSLKLNHLYRGLN